MKSLVSILLIFYSFTSFAVTFSGHIYDMESKEPIVNASIQVYIKGTMDISTSVTDSTGAYTIQLSDTWPEGEFPMRIYHEAYYTVNGIVLVKNQATRDFYIKKIPSEPNIQEITFDPTTMPTSNLVFLIDVSKSMNDEGKIEMLKIAVKKLVSMLRNTDRVSIVTYSTDAAVYMKTTPGDDTVKINSAIDKLECKGITMGGLGLDLAFAVAKKNYIPNANNKVILATDGKFTSTETKQYKSIEKLINKMKSKKIALTVFSFGNVAAKTEDNLKHMSVIGGGTYAHIENEHMAIEEMIDEAKNLGVFDKK